MDKTTDDHICMVIIPAVDAMIQSITALLNPWHDSGRMTDPGWMHLNSYQPLLNDLNGDVIWLNSTNN